MSALKGEEFLAATGTLRTNTGALTAPSAQIPAVEPPGNSSLNSVFAVNGADAIEFGMIITDADGETVNWALWQWTQAVIPEVSDQAVANKALYIPRRLCFGVATAGSRAISGDGYPPLAFLADTWAITEDVTLLPGVQTVGQPATPNNGFATIVVPIDCQSGVIVMETDRATAAGALPVARRLFRLPG